MFSGGDGSFRAAMIERARFPDAELRLVFTDVLYEDADTYRYLIEGAAHVLGRRLNWSVRSEDFPDYRVASDAPIEEYAGNPKWRAFLADLRGRATDAMPELVWIVEGRDPWEVFRDKLFLGNSAVDPCSRILKREAADDWMMAHCWRVGELFGKPDTFAVGIGEHEAHRFDDGQGGGVGPRKLKKGWLYHAPLLTHVDQLVAEIGKRAYSLLYAPLDEIGPPPPRLYGFGYSHGNCGGWCCKAGMAHFANRYRAQPERYAYDALMERKLRTYLGADVAMMTDRSGGGKRPLTLEEFEQRLRDQPDVAYEYEPGDSGCGCAIDEPAELAA